MATKVAMPKLGLIMTEGVVVKWLKDDGQSVKKGELIATIMSKKITYQVGSPAEGILRHVARIKETKPCGEAIAFITAPGEAVPAAEKVAAAARATPLPPAIAVGAPATRTPIAGVLATGVPKEILASPAAKKLGREHGLDLAEIPGTGPGGRVTEKDVLAFVQARHKPPATALAPSAAQIIPFAGVRQMIAQRMTESLQTMAQVTASTEVDVTEMVKMREQIKTKFDLTYTDIIIKAVTVALKEHPLLNSTLLGDEIQLLPEIHMGVAVALEDGLIVPVVRNADKLSLAEVARETRRLAESARAGTLNVDEATGSTFTITNLGMFGVDTSTPIINPPEVAILGVGRIIEKPAVFQGEIVKRSMMAMSLTFDHRIVDGAPAASFLRTLSGLLEKPYLLFV